MVWQLTHSVGFSTVPCMGDIARISREPLGHSFAYLSCLLMGFIDWSQSRLHVKVSCVCVGMSVKPHRIRQKAALARRRVDVPISSNDGPQVVVKLIGANLQGVGQT